MAARIPQGKLEDVATAAWDTRCAELESADRNIRRQVRFVDALERYRVGWRTKVQGVDVGTEARLSPGTSAAIGKAIGDAVAAPVVGGR